MDPVWLLFSQAPVFWSIRQHFVDFRHVVANVTIDPAATTGTRTISGVNGDWEHLLQLVPYFRFLPQVIP